MPNFDQNDPLRFATAQERICASCGEHFIFTKSQQQLFARRGWTAPKQCPTCLRELHKQRQKEQKQREDEKDKKRKEEQKKRFLEKLGDWRVVEKDAIHPRAGHALTIIGNGFDLMHRVPSSYYAFRDSLGKQSSLLFALENYLTSENIWGDFEEALAHINVEGMGSQWMVDNWLDTMNAYDEDASAADIFASAEYAANPILTITEELPQRFRMWVEKLSLGTNDRPLKNFFPKNSKVLCFNYTEFAETLYDVPEKNICYIHGCRRKKKYHPKETLILGHRPGASDEMYDFEDTTTVKRDPYQQYLLDSMQDRVINIIAEADEELTKDCSKIIAEHQAFFKEIGNGEIEDIIVVGLSFSPVDWDYFSEIVSKLPSRENVRWYFGCYSEGDLANLECLLAQIKIDPATVSVFRTDVIATTPLMKKSEDESGKKEIAEKIRCTSPDGQWVIKTRGNTLSIVHRETGGTDYRIIVPTSFGRIFFTPSGETLFVFLWGDDFGILLFHMTNGHWGFCGELESNGQSIVNNRLSKVLLTSKEITFVYNNRVRKYSLENGKLLFNAARQNARSFPYEGENITHLFRRER